jgi:hypothetical protein
MSPSDRMSPEPRALLPSADRPRSTAETVASYIRTLIFSGHLQHGERINQDDLHSDGIEGRGSSRPTRWIPRDSASVKHRPPRFLKFLSLMTLR